MLRSVVPVLWLAFLISACGEDLPSHPIDGPRAIITGAQALDPDVLHTIAITVAPEYLDKLENDRENRVPCTIVYDGQTLAQVGIRQKGGNGSVSDLQGKPGFSIKFDELVDGQKLDGMKKLVANNAIQDPTLLSEGLGYEIYRRAGLPAPRTAHAIVSLNGFTYGVYVLVEAVDGSFLEHWFGKGNHKGNLYEGGIGADFVSDPDSLELKDEAEDHRQRDDIRALAQACKDTPDEQLAQVVGQKLDLDGFIKGYALDALLDHWDGYSFSPNNYYLYDDPGTKRFVMLPHGMDQLLQNPSNDPFAPPPGALSARIRAVPELDQRFHDQVTRLLAEVWDVPALTALLEKRKALLDAAPRGEERVAKDIDALDASFDGLVQALTARKNILQGGE